MLFKLLENDGISYKQTTKMNRMKQNCKPVKYLFVKMRQTKGERMTKIKNVSEEDVNETGFNNKTKLV